MEHLTLLIGATAEAGAVEILAARGDEAGLAAALWRGVHRFDAAQAQAEGQALLRAARRSQGRGVAEGLVEPGRLLFDLLLPAPIKAILRGEAGTLLVAPGPLAELPWPLLHDGQDHLGLRWALGEVGEGDLGLRRLVPRGREGRLLVVADPAADLPAARFEGEALMAALAEGLPCDLRMGRLRRADFLRIFKSFRFIHFAGHADGADALGPGGWRLADGRVGSAELAALGGEASPLLVFANACRSALVPDLIPALLGAGVRLVIGTLLDLPDLPGAEFALQVYGALQDGHPVGEALRRARLAVAPHPVWAAYRLFGDPRTVCFERRVVAQWSPGVRSAVVLAARPCSTAPSPEALAEEMQQFRDVLRACVEAEGGRLLPGRAAVVRAVFGLPVGHENDAERAVRAGWALAQRVPTATVVLEAGWVTAVGLDVVGQAGLDAEAACWGGAPGLRLLPGAVRRVERLARVAPDGTWQGWRAAHEIPEPVLVGRQAELDRLVALVARREAVLVLGPAGQGKSRLASALAERLVGRVLVCRAVGESEAQPFAALVPLLRGLLGEGPVEAALDRLSPSDFEDFLSIDALLAGEQPRLRDRAAVLEAVLGGAAHGVDPAVVPVAVREVVEAAARAESLCLIFEDLHALTDATLAVVDELMGARGAAVVGTARPSLLERRPRWPGEHLVLEPLPEDAALALLSQVLPPFVTPEARRRLVERAEGNPLFLRELGLAHTGGEDEVPPTIEGVMLARLDRRSPFERQVLQAAAIFGHVFWPAGVERLLGTGVGSVLEVLARAGFVVREAQPVELPGLAWRFAHALLHAVVAQGIGQRVRRAWHGRAAIWLADEVGGEYPARVARHQAEAGDHARAALSWLRAAELATLAPAEAAQALAAALAADDQADALGAARRAGVEEALAARRKAEGDLAQADALLAAAVARDADPVRRAERLRRRAEVGEALGELARARGFLAEARELLGDLPEGLLVRQTIERDEAWLLWRDGRSEEAVARLTALLATLPTGHPLVGVVNNALGVAAWGRGEHAEAQRCYRLALAACEARGDLPGVSSAYNNLAILAMRQGDYAGAEASFKRGLRIKAEGGDREGLARAYNNLGTLYGEMADYPKAARYLTEAIRIRERVGHGSLAVSYANLGEVRLKQGQHAEAQVHLERALALCREGRGPAYLLPDVVRMLAELWLAQGQPDQAAHSAREAIEIARKSGDRSREGVALRVLGEALLAQGAEGAASALAEAILLLADEPTQRARAEGVLARLNPGPGPSTIKAQP
jgi:tetratricopeptide (TPR) repeat protein